MKDNRSIKECVKKSYVFLNLRSKTKDEVISEMLIKAEESGLRINISAVLERIYKKEKILTSGLGYGVAFPHTATSEVSEETIIFGISKEGVDYNSIDKKPVYLLAMILNPSSETDVYLSHLSFLSKMSRLTMYVVLLIESKTEEEFKSQMATIADSLEKSKI